MSPKPDQNEVKTLTISGEAGKTEQGALLCDLFMLGVFLWNQIRYGMDMLFLIVPLSLIGVGILVLCIVPESYCFTPSALETVHRFRRKHSIPYDTVFNYEASAHDSFVNILQDNTVRVYYMDGSKKKVTICRPRNVTSFVDALKTRCPEFQTQEQNQCSLSRLFEK